VSLSSLIYLTTPRKRRRFLGKKGFAEVIGHRGSRDHGLPENTLAAFIDASKVGVDMIELDVWLTKDNRVVVFHDSCLTRMTLGNHGAQICDLNYDELPDLIPSEEQSHRTSDYAVHHWNRIPLLSEVFEHLPSNISFNIEFKMNSDFLIAEVARLLHLSQRETNVFWFSLQEKINIKLRKANPKIPTVTSVTGSLFILVLYYTCLLPFYPLSDDVFGITLDEVCSLICRFNNLYRSHYMRSTTVL
jgi:glycerophosphoryl diester phosphodiesterase